MNFRAGIVGCGRIGSEFAEENLPTHAGVYKDVHDVELVALSDIDKGKLEKAGKRWGITSLYHDYKEMLKKEELDILSICTGASNHLEITREAVNSGVKAIYCEKPIADRLQNADEMIKLCHDNGVVLQINHQRRFDDLYRAIKEFLQRGGLGEIQQAAFYYTRGIANTGSHVFDLLRFLFGDVDWVQATYSQNKSHQANDPNLDGVVKSKKGLTCRIQACDDQNFTVFDMNFVGNKGELNIARNGSTVTYYKPKEGILMSGTPPFDTNVPRNSMLKAVEHLVGCLKEGKTSISSGEDGRAALELICAFHDSADANSKRIKLPLGTAE